MSDMAIYVPREGAKELKDVIAGSGIVEGAAFGVLVVVYFEGNRYGASNIITWADRVRMAAGRARDHYPTIAKRQVSRSSIIQVGWIDHDLNRLDVNEYNEADIARWLGVELPLPARELAFT